MKEPKRAFIDESDYLEAIEVAKKEKFDVDEQIYLNCLNQIPYIQEGDSVILEIRDDAINQSIGSINLGV